MELDQDLAAPQWDSRATIVPMESESPMLARRGTLVGSENLPDVAVERTPTVTAAEEGWHRHNIVFTSKAEFCLPARYRDVTKISEGGCGLVAEAHDVHLDQKVAIKKIRGAWDSRRQAKCTFRELRLLRYLELNWQQYGVGQARTHENVMGMINCFTPPLQTDSGDIAKDLYIVMEHGGKDLNYYMQTINLEPDHIQFFGYQIACGLKYVHSSGILHRDLKPSNVAVSDDNDVKILDFGLARLNEPDETTSTNGYISTRPYRAPEVALHVGHQHTSLDMWSFGVIFGELLFHRACRDRGETKYRLNLFEGDDMLEQLKKIAKVIGPPSKTYVNEIDSEAKVWLENAAGLMDQPTRPLSETKEFSGADPVALDLLTQLLQWNPEKRLSAEACLAHPYFESYCEPDCEPVCAEPFNDEYEKECDDLTANDWRELCVREMAAFAKMDGMCQEIDDIRNQLFPPEPEMDDEHESSEANTMEDVELPLPLSADETARLEIRQAELLGLLRGMEIGLNNIDAFKHAGRTR